MDTDISKPTERPLLGIPVVARRIGLCAATMALSLVAVSACGSSNSSTPMQMPSSMAAPASSGTASSGMTSSGMDSQASMIMIQDFEYTTPVTVSPGATVSVMNMDSENHTVTADTGKAFDLKAVAGATATFTAPMKPGSYAYHCAYHSEMHGVLIVR